jgi:hypothetical protein
VIRDVDKGYRKAIANAAALNASHGAKVGILEDKPYDDGMTVADVAMIHEYGLGDAPERSWLRAWVDENQAAIEARLKTEVEAALFGKRTAEQAMERFGLWAVGEIKKRIIAGIGPALADETVKRKGSSTPLIDSGQLLSSITHQVVANLERRA